MKSFKRCDPENSVPFFAGGAVPSTASYLSSFGGVVLIYAISGFLLNHKRDFNAEYDITRKEFRVESMPQSARDGTKLMYSRCSDR